MSVFAAAIQRRMSRFDEGDRYVPLVADYGVLLRRLECQSARDRKCCSDEVRLVLAESYCNFITPRGVA